MKKKKLSLVISYLKELESGKMQGGFSRLTVTQKIVTYAGTDTDDGDGGTNNCNGGNCTSGCGTIGTNVGSSPCGSHLNVVPGCGT